MPKIAKTMRSPLAYTEVRNYIGEKFKEPDIETGYISLDPFEKILFLQYVPHLTTESILKHSVEKYCPKKSLPV